MGFTRSEFTDLTDQVAGGKKRGGPSMKPGARQKGSMSRPPRTNDPRNVGTLQRQTAPVNQQHTQSVGSSKLARTSVSENPTRAGWDGVGKKKQAQESKVTAPKSKKGPRVAKRNSREMKK